MNLFFIPVRYLIIEGWANAERLHLLLLRPTSARRNSLLLRYLFQGRAQHLALSSLLHEGDHPQIS
jgi:hypothetical protein